MESTPPPVGIDDQHGLSFADGFQFGCGFFLAAAVAAVLVLLLLALIVLILSLTGVSLLKDLLGSTGALLSLTLL